MKKRRSATNVESVRRAGTQSIERAVEVLRFLAADLGNGVRVADVSKYLDLQPATAHRILQALVRAQFAEQDAATHRYRLGPLVYELGLAVTPSHNFPAICEESVARLAEITGDVAMLIVRSGIDSVCMDRKEGASPIRTLTGQIGIRRPLGIGAGSLAILSALSPEAAERIIDLNKVRYAQFNGVTTKTLLTLVEQARARGYAHTSGEVFSEVGGVGMVIRDSRKSAIAALTIATTVARLGSQRVVQIAKLLRSEVKKIEEQI